MPEEQEKDECQGCQRTDYEGELVAVYEGDDPDTGYRGSDEPTYLCWDCRHPDAARHAATEARYAERALLIVGIDSNEVNF